ncbi:MAG TPA: FBP domain-containing protein [Candidatus Saccharimonadales bacterium]|nr:FBP domain-containing protein [Candidatus Saccharimonadales bacterium]
MNYLDKPLFDRLIAEASIKPRLKRELRFMASTEWMTKHDWLETELLAIADRSGNKGVLLLAPDDDLYILPYERSRGLAGQKSGRTQPIICDFCRTWQSGGAGSITFTKDRSTVNSVSYLCCADLECSRNVRTKTAAATVSRAQLREDLTDLQRVERLKGRLRELIARFELSPARTMTLPKTKTD